MTDYTKLIERLRDPREQDEGLCIDAADAIEALQATQASQSMQLAHDAVTIECLNDKVEALQGEVENWKKANRAISVLNKCLATERDALAAELAGLRKQGPVGFVAPHDLKTLREGYPATVVMLPSNKRTEPLFAAPKALAPLTPSQYNMALSCIDVPPRLYEAITRAIEASHGIGGTP